MCIIADEEYTEHGQASPQSHKVLASVRDRPPFACRGGSTSTRSCSAGTESSAPLALPAPQVLLLGGVVVVRTRVPL